MWTAGARQQIPLRLDAPIGLTRHGAAAAGLRQAPRMWGISGLEARIGVGERSGRLRPYVRPVARCSPLAIMGVRVRVRRQSGSRARGTTPSTALPELSRPQPSPSRRSALAAGSGGPVPAAYRACRDVTPWLPKRPRRVPSPGRSPCASSAPIERSALDPSLQARPAAAGRGRCAPSCLPAPPSPAGRDAAPAARGSTHRRRCSTRWRSHSLTL